MALSYGVFILLLILAWYQRKCWKLVWELNGWRGILQQPILWVLLVICMDPKKVLETIKYAKKWFRSPLAIIVGFTVLLYVDDPEIMKEIFNAPECINKTFMQDGFFIRGLLLAKGQKWKTRRRQLNPAFSQSILLSFFETFNNVGNQLQQKLSVGSQASALKFKTLEDLLSRAVLEASCKTTMGTDIKFTEEDSRGIAITYKTLLEISALRIIKPWLQIEWIFRLMDPENYRRSVRCNKLVEQFVSEIVYSKHEEWKQKELRDVTNNNINKNNSRNNIIDVSNPIDISYVAKSEESGDETETQVKSVGKQGALSSTYSKQKRIFIEQIFYMAEQGELTLQDIIDESHSMVLVSFETISNSVIIALLVLAIHPDCQHKLRSEICKILSSDIYSQITDSELNTNSNTGSISAEQLKKMTYLEMVVNESLRLMTTVPINMRHVSSNFLLHLRRTNVPAENAIVTIPKDTLVVLDTFNMQRDEVYWGPHAKQFRPEHFAADNFRTHSHAFVPFSTGLRTCIGMRYSFYLMKILLVKLISTFEFRTDVQMEDLSFIDGVTLKLKNVDNITFQIQKVLWEEGKQQ